MVREDLVRRMSYILVNIEHNRKRVQTRNIHQCKNRRGLQQEQCHMFCKYDDKERI
jgi:hypothetical protein